MGCQTQKPRYRGRVEGEATGRPKLTPKGERTRARIVEAAARLIHERGVAGTTLDDIRSAAAVSGSQLSHYFADKDELVRAVVDYQAETITGNQRQADLGNPEGLQAWRDMIVAQVKGSQGKGGNPARLPRRAARRNRPAGPRPDRRGIRAVVGRHRRRAAQPARGRAPASRH
jgi:AcrR family transcriptional regulator